jgi:hypothetical protein
MSDEQDTTTPTGTRVAELWVWTVVTAADEEQLVTIGTPTGPVAAIAGDEIRRDEMAAVMPAVAGELGLPVRLRHFIPADDDGEQRVVSPPVLS